LVKLLTGVAVIVGGGATTIIFEFVNDRYVNKKRNRIKPIKLILEKESS
jgi:hypothetical protein